MQSPLDSPLTGIRSPFGRRLGTAFNALMLFQNGEQGVAFEPDPNTCFTDTAATTTAGAGDSTAFMLDGSQGAGYKDGEFTGLGSETQPPLADGENWSGANWVVSGGIASPDGTQTSAIGLSANIGVTAGRFYKVAYDITNRTAGFVRSRFGSELHTFISNTRDIVVFVDTTGSFSIQATADFDGEISNISVRELPGNHAVQDTAAARPILARVPEGGQNNILSKQAQFDDGGWAKTRTSISLAPSQPSYQDFPAWKLVDNTDTNSHNLGRGQLPALEAGTYTYSIVVKAAEIRYIQARLNVDPANTGPKWNVVFDLQDGVVTDSNPSDNPTNTGSSIEHLGNGIYYCSITIGNPSGLRLDGRIFLSQKSVYDANPVYAGTGTGGIYIWTTQLEPNDTANPLQRYTSEYDVTEAGKADKWHLVFNGVDNFMETPSIDFTGTDEMSVFAGISFDSVGANSNGTLFQLGTSTATDNGSFFLRQKAGGSDIYQFSVRSTSTYGPISSYSPGLVNNVFSALVDFAAPRTITRVNGVQETNSPSPPAGVNFGNYSFYFGMRGGSDLPSNYSLFSFIARGKLSSDAEIDKTEKLVADRTAGVDL